MEENYKSAQEIMVEVAYALPKQQVIIPLMISNGSTAQDAVLRSGILDKFPEINLEKNALGIFGKAIRKDTVLRAMDRVEIYRELIADPKEVRRQRAAEGKVMKKGGGDITEDNAS